MLRQCDSPVAERTKSHCRRRLKHSSPVVYVMLLCVCWYSSASVAIVTSKKVLMHTAAPFCISTTQFLSAAFCAAAVALSRRGGLRNLAVPVAQRKSVLKVISCFVLGFLFTNLSFGLLAAPTVETIKTTQTVTSVLLSIVFSAVSTDPFPSVKELLCMIPIVSGVFVATYSDLDLVPRGVVAALAANLSFSFRGAFMKAHRFKFRQDAVGALTLFFWASCLGSIAALVCATLYGEPLGALIGQQYPLTVLVRHINNLSGWGAFNVALNGIMYFTYNYCSFRLLEHVTFLTHSAVNACRRCVIIGVTSWWFHRGISFQNIMGVAVAVVGFMAFLWAKSDVARNANKNPTHTSNMKL